MEIYLRQDKGGGTIFSVSFTLFVPGVVRGCLQEAATTNPINAEPDPQLLDVNGQKLSGGRGTKHNPLMTIDSRRRMKKAVQFHTFALAGVLFLLLLQQERTKKKKS